MPHLSRKKGKGELVVTVCDSELFGKTFEEGDFSLEVDKSFYEGEEVNIEECLEALKEATIANLVGSIVERAEEEGYINSNNILEIEGVQHAQMARP